MSISRIMIQNPNTTYYSAMHCPSILAGNWNRCDSTTIIQYKGKNSNKTLQDLYISYY